MAFRILRRSSSPKPSTTRQRFITDLIDSLSISQRNALRTVLAYEDGASTLWKELGLPIGTGPMSESERRTGLARSGRTSELFPTKHSPANIEVLGLIFAIILAIVPGAKAQVSVIKDTMPDGTTYSTTCIHSRGYSSCSTSVTEPGPKLSKKERQRRERTFDDHGMTQDEKQKACDGVKSEYCVQPWKSRAEE